MYVEAIKYFPGPWPRESNTYGDFSMLNITIDKNHFSEDRVAQYWDENAANWAEHVRKGWDAYREYFNNPAFFEFIGDLSQKTVLDAGCGEGYNTRILAGKGANLVGVDISKNLIALALKKEEQEGLGTR